MWTRQSRRGCAVFFSALALALALVVVGVVALHADVVPVVPVAPVVPVDTHEEVCECVTTTTSADADVDGVVRTTTTTTTATTKRQVLDTTNFTRACSTGMHIHLLTKEDTLAYAARKNAETFRALSGHCVSVHEVHRDELFDEIVADMDSARFYDLYIMSPQWIADLMDCTVLSCAPLPDAPPLDDGSVRVQTPLESMSERVRDDTAIEWTDVARFFRVFSSSFGGEIVSMPLDGDIHFGYYRTDVFAAHNLRPPRTWTEVRDAARTLFEKPAAEIDFDSDGVANDTPLCISMKKTYITLFLPWDFAAGTLQYQGTSQGLFFSTDEAFTPRVNNPAMRRGLELMKELTQYATINLTDFSFREARGPFVDGRCAFTLDWGDIPPIMNDTIYREVVGQLILPGDTHVLDTATNELRECTAELCPHSVVYDDGVRVNHAPYAAFGGWSGSLSGYSTAARKQVAYDFFSHMSQASDNDVIDGGTGLQPYRISHLRPEMWIDAGFPSAMVDNMLGGVTETLNSPNLVMDLRIKGTKAYTKAVDDELSEYLQSRQSVDEMMANLERRMNEITEEKGGRREQVQTYRSTIGLPALDFTYEVFVSKGARIAIIVVSALLIVLAVALLVVMFVHRSERVWRCSSLPFMGMILVGAVLTYVAMVLFSAYPTRGTCTTGLWLLVLGFSLMLSAILAKTYRIWAVFRNVHSMRSVVLTNTHLLPIVGVICCASTALLIVWTAIDAPSPMTTTEGLAPLEYAVVCDSPEHGEALFISLIVWFVVLLVVTLMLSFNTRNVAAAFNEAKPLSMCVYNQLQALIILIVAVFALTELTARYVLVSIAVLFGVSITVVLIFTPKLWKSVRGKGDAVEVHSKTTRRNMTPSSRGAADSAGGSRQSSGSAQSSRTTSVAVTPSS